VRAPKAGAGRRTTQASPERASSIGQMTTPVSPAAVASEPPVSAAPGTVLGVAPLRAAIVAFRDALRAHREAINALNVYPVPDGDTGTNMTLTMESVVAAVDAASTPDDASSPEAAETAEPQRRQVVCAAVAEGSLMGARGNSGVILSQLLRGLTDGLAAAPVVGPQVLADALAAASASAYKAVLRPVEGTILTVAREASAAAVAAAGAGADLLGVLTEARRVGADALARTPDLLPVLRDAGVVDAGGTGLLLLLDAFLHALDGRPLPEAPAVDATAPGGAVRTVATTVDELRYEVMYLLDLDDDRIDDFKARWGAVGDSIVVVGSKGRWNCHVHTDDIGAAVEAALDVGGRPHRIRVTDLRDEVEERDWVREAGGAGAVDDPASATRVSTGVVAVGVGDGIARIFRSLGVHVVVAGGQSMNPSTAELLDAAKRVPADNVVILPNNKNIVPVARQVDGLCDKSVAVVPTRAVAEGFAALVAYDPDGDLQANVEAMAAAADHVVAGEVTQAVRDASSPAGPIRVGDWLGIGRDRIEVVAPTLAAAAIGLLERIVTDDHELVTLVVGADAGADDTDAVQQWLAEHRPDVEVEVHHGGQPLYPFYVGVE
jgi:DAK2 domain fusion protein YloV